MIRYAMCLGLVACLLPLSEATAQRPGVVRMSPSPANLRRGMFPRVTPRAVASRIMAGRQHQRSLYPYSDPYTNALMSSASGSYQDSGGASGGSYGDTNFAPY